MKLTAVFEAIMATKYMEAQADGKYHSQTCKLAVAACFVRSNEHMLQPDGQVAVANWYFMIILVTFLVSL